MRVLAVSEFDPANVLGGHRRALRAAGVDYRLCVETIYRPWVQGGKPDWSRDYPADICNFDELYDFASSVDVVIFNPVIGQPWSYTTNAFNLDDADLRPYLRPDGRSIRWNELGWPRRKIAYFHGSRNFQDHRDRYHQHYASQGFKLWASTLNHVAAGNGLAAYAPPAVWPFFASTGKPWTPARLRDSDDPIFAVQAPTDEKNCHTAEFREACIKLGIPHHVITDQPHDAVMKIKAVCNLGFDHLRGGFSVNSVENMFLGLLPVFSMSVREVQAYIHADLIPGWPVHTRVPQLGMIGPGTDLLGFLKLMQAEPERHRQGQVDALQVAQDHFTDKAVAERLLKLLEAP